MHTMTITYNGMNAGASQLPLVSEEHTQNIQLNILHTQYTVATKLEVKVGRTRSHTEVLINIIIHTSIYSLSHNLQISTPLS